jgi:hypothetical protein
MTTIRWSADEKISLPACKGWTSMLGTAISQTQFSSSVKWFG